MANYMITTFDNVWNPFTHFKEWFSTDIAKGYYTCEWLNKLSLTSPNLDDDEIENDVEYAANRLLELNPYGVHYKVYQEEAETLIPLMYKTYYSLPESERNATKENNV